MATKKKKERETQVDRERPYAVALEAIRSDFRVFGEKLSSVDEGLRGFRKDVDTRFQRVDGELSLVKAAILQHDRTLVDHGHKIDAMDKKLDQHDRTLVDHGRKIDAMDKKLDAMDKKLDRKADRSEVVAMVERVLDSRR